MNPPNNAQIVKTRLLALATGTEYGYCPAVGQVILEFKILE